ncbi:uncharacterized protein LAESUDRAFT_402461 [Laetiporus sulphureus 93-53]|uniref:DUF6534 domain-containing protein n=1 Tax=Laetiporus sulphureus 93-53 TaxID=1314785 RepID=A0A165CC53_9APHY|nr:uncharacterized protein LAESUDRAFT_402461 [Laetiporus sulphureus 93-53]KZT02545.1 hypothetical protein LAESUDRAFT_402461 [Laetiporus sulphureus 93-53]
MSPSGSNFALAPTLGATYIGTIFGAILFGVTNVQTYMYYKRSKNDPLLMKILVFCLWILDCLHQAFITHAFYTYAVIDFSNVLALLAPEWSVMAHVFVASTSDTLVRGLFCHRVYLLSDRNWVITTAIAISTMVVFGSSWAFAIKGLSLSDYFDLTSITWFIYTSLISAVVADVLIASSLCILLSRRRSAFARTNSVVRVLMIYSINTGALTSLCSIICLIIYATEPNATKFTFIAIYFVLPKLFLNSLLASLNARQGLRERPPGHSVVSSSSYNHKTEQQHSGGERSIQIHIRSTSDIKTVDTITDVSGEHESWNAL